ncbi:hypothetical protein AHF37_12151 [Paragonimus kellicotti]|nr:hypothetical protein AHF37_12151 [Paragonimus kellicotti]
MSFRKALDIYLKQYKPSSPIVLRAKNNLASALLKRGYASDAEILLKAVLSPDQSTQRSSYHTWNNTGALSTTEADSAVFSFSSISSSYNPRLVAVARLMVSWTSPLGTLVLLLPTASFPFGSRLSRFDVSAWATEAQIDLVHRFKRPTQSGHSLSTPRYATPSKSATYVDSTDAHDRYHLCGGSPSTIRWWSKTRVIRNDSAASTLYTPPIRNLVTGRNEMPNVCEPSVETFLTLFGTAHLFSHQLISCLHLVSFRFLRLLC